MTLPVAVGAERPWVREAALVSSKEEAAAGGAEWGQCALWGLAEVQLLAGGNGMVWAQSGGGCGLSLASLSMQDSDGDKSDDLVVDVSNEVRAVPGRRVAFCVGSWRWFLSQVGAVGSRLLHPYRQPQLGLRPLGWGHQAGQEEEDRAWLLGGWGVIYHAGFLGWVSRERDP